MKNEKLLTNDLNDIDKKRFKAVPDMAPMGYFDWQENRDTFQELFPLTDSWLISCFNMPNQIEIMLHMYDEVLNGFGVEAIQIEGEYVNSYYRDIVADYVNMGDTYALTILYDAKQDKFMVTTVGDFIKIENY